MLVWKLPLWNWFAQFPGFLSKQEIFLWLSVSSKTAFACHSLSRAPDHLVGDIFSASKPSPLSPHLKELITCFLPTDVSTWQIMVQPARYFFQIVVRVFVSPSKWTAALVSCWLSSKYLIVCGRVRELFISSKVMSATTRRQWGLQKFFCYTFCCAKRNVESFVRCRRLNGHLVILAAFHVFSCMI